MTKKTESRKLRDKGGIPRRNLNPIEMRETKRMTELVNGEIWKADLIKNNTALITGGQALARQADEVSRLLLNAKNHYVAQVLRSCGIGEGLSVNINLDTGEIKEETADERAERLKKEAVDNAVENPQIAKEEKK